MRHAIVALVSCLGLLGCGDASMEEAQEKLNAYARQTDLHFSRSVSEVDAARGLRPSCSKGRLCGPESLAWEYRAENLRLHLSFNQALTQGMGPEELRKNLYRVRWSVGPLDGLSVPGWTFTAEGDRVASAGLGYLTAFENGRLQGTIKDTSELLQGLRDDPEACADETPDDQNWPRGCFVNAATRLQVNLAFDLPLAPGPVDCRGSAPPADCH